MFKGEKKKFEGDGLATQFSKYFNIDTKLLNLAIKSIPFNERHIISGIEWTEGELERFKEETRICEQAYKELLETTSKFEEKKDEKVAENIQNPNIQEKKTKIEPPKSDDKKSMERWLDDILDL